MSQLFNLLGKTFADRNNSPIPIIFKSPEKLEGAILKACSCTYIHLKGQTISVRVGLTSMSEDNVVANALEGVENAVAKFDGAWNDVTTIHLKLSDSPALPIYKIKQSIVQKVVNKKGAAVDNSLPVDTATVPAVKGKNGKAAGAVATPVVVPVVINEEESIAALKSAKKAAKKASKKEVAEKETSITEAPAAIIVPVIAAVAPAAVVAAATTSTPGKKRSRPDAAVEISSPAVVAVQEPATKVKKSAKKAAKKD